MINLSAIKPTQLKSALSSTAVQIRVKEFATRLGDLPDFADLDTDWFVVVIKQGDQWEQIKIDGFTQETDGSATLDIATNGRNILPISPYTGSSTGFDFGVVAEVILTNDMLTMSQFAKKDNDETITGQWTFDTFPITPSNSDASTTVKGVTKLSVAPVSATDPIAVGTNDDRVPVGYGASSNGTDTYTVTPTPAITAYVTGQRYLFKADVANTGACSVNYSGVGAISIKKDVSTDLITGDILAGQIVECVYDGTNMQLVSVMSGIAGSANIQIFTTEATSYGGHTTRFDITNPSGTTFRYTYDGTGIDPTINSTTFPVGAFVEIQATGSGSAISNSNLGLFVITGSGTNYFEINNSLGVAENDKVLDPGGFLSVSTLNWTKPDNAKMIEVITIGGGSGGGFGNVKVINGNQYNGGAGGSGGAYARALFRASDIGSTEKINVGFGGEGGNAVSNAVGEYGGTSSFGSLLRAYGGGGGEASGTVTNGSGGGGGTGGKGARGDTTAAVNGGLPNSGTGAGAGGQGAGGSFGGVGKSAEYGGAGGGTGQNSAVGYVGGSSLYGGAGGGAGGGINGATPGVPAAGGAGGVWGSYIAGGGVAGGAATGVAGTAGISRSGYGCGDGGSGGGANNTGSSGAGGAGGVPGGGGGGGGSNAVSTTGASGGKGGRGEVRVITYF